MAKEEDVCELEEVSDEPKGKKVAKHDAGAADLEKVTDYVEEAEISSQNISDVSMIHNNDGNMTSTRYRQYIIAHTPSPASFFFGVRIRLGTILGRFSIIYFRGLGVRVWVWVSVVLWSG